MIQTEGDENVKEWQLFKTIDFANEGEQLEFTGLDFTEIFIIATGLCNTSESTASGMNIIINNNIVAQMSTQPASGSSEKNQQLLLKYNELFWEQSLTPQSNNASYYITYSNKQAPYSARLNVGKCETLKFAQHVSAYPIQSGTVEVYAR